MINFLKLKAISTVINAFYEGKYVMPGMLITISLCLSLCLVLSISRPNSLSKSRSASRLCLSIFASFWLRQSLQCLGRWRSQAARSRSRSPGCAGRSPDGGCPTRRTSSWSSPYHAKKTVESVFNGEVIFKTRSLLLLACLMKTRCRRRNQDFPFDPSEIMVENKSDIMTN